MKVIYLVVTSDTETGALIDVLWAFSQQESAVEYQNTLKSKQIDFSYGYYIETLCLD